MTKKKVKVGLVCPYNVYRFGGVQEFVFAQADHLEELGYEVKIVSPTPKFVPKEVRENVVTIGHSKEVRTPLKTTADLSYTASKKEIEDMLKDEKFDLLHFHEPWVPLLSKQLLTVSHKMKIPNVATFHAKLPDGATAKTIKRLMRPYAKPTIPKIDKLVAVSEPAKENIDTLTDREIMIIPNAVEMSFFDPKEHEPHPLTTDELPSIVYVARLETRKGARYLIEAVSELNKEKNTGVRLIFSGDGPLREELEQLVVKEGLYNVHFLGFTSNEDKASLLKGATIFCSPAPYGESFGITLIEAMAMGAPIIAGNNPGYESVLIDDGKVGIVDPTDTKKFAKLIEKFLKDEKLRESLSKWGQKEVKKYSFETVVKQYDELYKEVLGGK